MLITNLMPLLSRYSLGFDLIAGADNMVTLTVIPRKAEGAKRNPDGAEIRPISITATAAEIDEELAKGADGALGQLIMTRKSLADQIADQAKAADAAKTAAKPKAKPEPAAQKAEASPPPVPSAPVAEPKSGEPASLW
jgi:PRTRC genetic system protein E